MQTIRDSNVLPPAAPTAVRETGMSLTAIAELVIRILYFHGEITAQQLVQIIRLAYDGIVKLALEHLLKEQLVGRSGSRGMGEMGFLYVLGPKGMVRARELLDINQYAGPAPVPMEDYHAVAQAQTITHTVVDDRTVRQSLMHLVLGDDLIEQLGPAVNSARSIFLHGPPGDGKTVIAEALTSMLGGDIYVPYAIQVEGHIIRVFDPVTHQPVVADGKPEALAGGGGTDPRWVRCRRPTIIVGGELTLDMLELLYDTAARTYEAPLQMKANGGAFMIDDFGRQRVHPRELLNRWVLPLERRVDFLSLLKGKKIEVPFDVLIIFSTNLAPRDLVDEAFLRRIRHKISVGDPSLQQFREIMLRSCESRQIAFEEAGYDYLMREHFQKTGRPLRCVHPRDLLDQILDIARYLNVRPAMTPELIDRACRSYFVDLR
ncbi:MAG: ATP-binding protein [Verrucomicrobia bacterium]|nr:ATP-binding protein [Verrucomicrobiota bacterium]